MGSVVVIPAVIAFLPRDYFRSSARPLGELGPLRLLGRLLKNLLGLLFLLAGFAMLFIPGQGILTSILGLSLIDFPGKRHLELRLLRAPRVQRMIQWCRRKTGREPLEIPDK